MYIESGAVNFTFKINWHDFSPKFPLFSGARICDGSPIDVANSRALFLFYSDQ